MNEHKEFLLPKHKQLISIAIWAKHLSWVVLVVYIALAGLTIIQKQANYQQLQSFGLSQSTQNYWDMVKQKPVYLIDIGSAMTGVFVRGIVFYLALKGISLGLTMIVETDINYREKKNDGVHNEQ